MSRVIQKKIAAISLMGMIVISNVPGQLFAEEKKVNDEIDPATQSEFTIEKVVMQVGEKIEEVTKEIKVTEQEVQTKEQARAYLEKLISSLALKDEKIEIVDEAFEPAVEGMQKYQKGIDGHYKYNIIYDEASINGTMQITATPYIETEAGKAEQDVIRVGKRVKEATEVLHVSQSEVETKADAKAYLLQKINRLDLEGVDVEITEEVFDPTIKGLPQYRSGFDGYYRYNIVLSKGEFSQTLYGKDYVYGKMFIKALPYED